MREILFRGRKRGGTEWFEGDLSYLVHDKRECYIFPPDGYNSPDWYEVDPATVGQYTGLSDKHGRKIFEADILGFVNNDGDLSLHIVEWDAEGAKWIIRYPQKDHTEPDDMADWDPREWEVLGTQWDNPELLEEAGA